MATSYFGLTPNTESPETPSQTTYQARDRYARAGITGELRYPLATTEFNVPFMRFVFLDAYADTLSGSPTIFIQVPNLFNISDFSDYSRTEAIFGAPVRPGLDGRKTPENHPEKTSPRCCDIAGLPRPAETTETDRREYQRLGSHTVEEGRK